MTAASPWTPRVLAACAAGAALAVAAALTAASAKAATPAKLTIYSVPVKITYLNKEDDRERAEQHNPFGIIDAAKLATDETKGPGAGDSTFYKFNLYTTPTLKKKAGSAVYSCDYNFKKQALCSAYFIMNGSTLYAVGPVDFKATGFTLAVTGGTRKYAAANGEVVMAPIGKNKQRLRFNLVS